MTKYIFCGDKPMKKEIKQSCISIITLTLAACGSGNNAPQYDSPNEVAEDIDSTNQTTADGYTFGDDNDEFYTSEGTDISIPFYEKGGVKYVKVSVCGFGFEMIFDTGCSGTLISIAEAQYLYNKGYLTEDDFIGVSKSQIADGSVVENMVVMLRDVVIDDKINCGDVEATVSSNNNAPLLLGNEILNRVASYSVDNENKNIIFKLK